MTAGFLLRRDIDAASAAGYVVAQVLGAILGASMAHAMFDLSLLQIGTTPRAGAGLWLAETVATFALMTVILRSLATKPSNVGWHVGLYIAAAYWFTASTSFANPALTIARMFTDTVAGIRPVDAPAYILAQFLGAGLAVMLERWFRARS